ncbi:hypothetical protein DEJ50_23555 [Streptomyces venezuelae]|uniref:Lipoprotein n=1 Tax=Streptomyces venezuelae TaxID=54571 RepID=A0A5P2D586_STRVZ|nr:hypothetical protein DEJ50_23555 [Streptomyces venezuelae]
MGTATATAAAVVAAVVALGAGCAKPAGPAGAASPTGPAAGRAASGTPAAPSAAAGGAAEGAVATRDFGKAAAQADIDAATAAAGLPASGSPGTNAPSLPPQGQPDSELDALLVRGWACTAMWSEVGFTGGPGQPEDPRGRFDATVKELVARGWATGKRTEEPVSDPSATGGGKQNGTAVYVLLTKRNWSLQARHTVIDSMWMTGFTATEDACVNSFTERELKLLDEAGDRRRRGSTPGGGD